ncbi:MAG: hypothetical protein IH587_13095 [Anaerolineae bacterium]|nr:hypothetical protein [Anaerolineae bacterium]
MQLQDPDTIIRNTDPALLTLLAEKLNTLVKWDVMQFFHRNPHAMDTVGQIAEALGRDLESVASTTAELAEAGLLQMRRGANATVFMLADDEAIRKEIDAFMCACDNATFRRCAIQYVLNASTDGN